HGRSKLMESNKVGPGIPTALTNNVPVQKNQTIQKETESLASKARQDRSDFAVALSEKAKGMAEARSKALEVARNTPDIREDRVADLKRRIESGEYSVDSGRIADGMLREAIRDELAKNPPEV
ncbi:MAG: flagellar biosynthesis anti-sigma factor FlgM, partial [Oligoflexus sp.]